MRSLPFSGENSVLEFSAPNLVKLQSDFTIGRSQKDEKFQNSHLLLENFCKIKLIPFLSLSIPSLKESAKYGPAKPINYPLIFLKKRASPAFVVRIFKSFYD